MHAGKDNTETMEPQTRKGLYIALAVFGAASVFALGVSIIPHAPYLLALLVLCWWSFVLVGRVNRDAPRFFGFVSRVTLNRPKPFLLATGFLIFVFVLALGIRASFSASDTDRAMAQLQAKEKQVAAMLEKAEQARLAQLRELRRKQGIEPRRPVTKPPDMPDAGPVVSRGDSGASYEGLYNNLGEYKFGDCSPFEIRVANAVYRELYKNPSESQDLAMRRIANRTGLDEEVAAGIYAKAMAVCKWKAPQIVF